MELLDYFLLSFAEVRRINPSIKMSASGRNVNASTIQAKLSIKMATCSILSHFRFKLIITSFSCPFEIYFSALSAALFHF